MAQPNFIIIGAQRSGTTSMHTYLSDHPNVCMSRDKEPCYFSRSYRPFDLPCPEDRIGVLWYEKKRLYADRKAYLSLFDDAPHATAVGESSAEYMYYSACAQAIAKFDRNMKILAIVRHPVDRAFSAYTSLLFKEAIQTDFQTALNNESAYIERNYHYKWHFCHVSLYADSIARFIDTFGAPQVNVILFDDLIENPLRVMRQVSEFLGIDASFYNQYAFAPQNPSGLVKNRSFSSLINQASIWKRPLKAILPHRLLREIKSKANRLNIEKPMLDPTTARQLQAYFIDDLLKLEALLSIDLIQWKEKYL